MTGKFDSFVQKVAWKSTSYEKNSNFEVNKIVNIFAPVCRLISKITGLQRVLNIIIVKP